MERYPSDVSSPFFTPQTPDGFEFPNQTFEKNEWRIPECDSVFKKKWSFPECDSVFIMDYCNEETELTATSGGLPYSQANQHQPNQVEISEGSYQTKPEGGTGRAKLTPIQKRENKRQSDYRYRQKQKLTLKELTAQNSFLKAEYDRLTDEKRQLKSDITWLLRNQQFPSEPASQQLDNKSLSFQDQHGEDWIVVDQDHHGTNSGAADKPSGLEGNGSDLQNLHQQIPITVVATNRPIAQLLMQKIEADDESNVCFSDFTGLDGELVKVGKYSFPLSLHPVVERIIAVYGDVSATTKVNLFIAEATYILFCASVKEMGELQLEQVTEDRILKWRDAIKDALRINFKVDFAMEHLKKIAHAYIGRIESQELESMSERISKLEADLNTRREELAKRKVLSKKYMDAAEGFNGRSLSLLP